MWNLRKNNHWKNQSRSEGDVQTLAYHLQFPYHPLCTSEYLYGYKNIQETEKKKVAHKRKTVITERTFSINKTRGLLDTLGRCQMSPMKREAR